MAGSQTATHIEWSSAQKLIECLIEDDNHRLALYVALGINLGLRDSDIRPLTLSMLSGPDVVIREKKTGKDRRVTVNKYLRDTIDRCRPYLQDQIFLNRIGSQLVTIQYIGTELKKACRKHLRLTEGISTHTLRKTFGRRVYELAHPNAKGEALYMLCNIFNHADTNVTKRYINITADEIANVYLSLG